MYLVRIFLPSGISLDAARQYPDLIRSELIKYDEVKGVMAQLGRNDDGMTLSVPNRIEAMIQLKQPYNTWKVKRSKKEFVIDL